MNSTDTRSAQRTWTWSWPIFPLLLMTLKETMVTCALRQLPTEHVREFTCGKLYYRTLHLDSKTDVLYVGAMDKLFRLKLSNISHSHCEKDSLNLEPSNPNACISKGKSEEFDCRNHIKVIQPISNGNRLYICGTNAYSPKDWIIYTNLTHLSQNEYVPGTGIGKCPYDPADNSTAIWIQNGNPDDIPALYSGTNADFTKSDALIFRTDLYNPITGRRAYDFKRTPMYDYNSLNKPSFVGSFEIGPHVFFFFREIMQIQKSDFGVSVLRVARVCKSDTGGESFMAENWVTFRKARLNCSIPGEFPIYFNEIQSIYKVPGDNTRFYGTFTTSNNGITDSAICSFHMKEIQEAFRGGLKKQRGSGSSYSKVHFSDTMERWELGQCNRDTKSIPITDLVDIRDHPLMESVISSENGEPGFYMWGVLLTRLVIDQLQIDLYENCLNVTVYYAGSNVGRVYKVVQYVDDHFESHSYVVDIFDVTPGEPIRAMEISKEHETLYVASDHRIKQIDLVMCSRRYQNWFACIYDPYCGWDVDTNSCLQKKEVKSTRAFYFA